MTPKTKHWTSVGIGGALVLVGLVLWLAAGGVDTPVVSLEKLGVVLLVLGAIEVLVSGSLLASPSTRNRDFDL